MSRTKVVGWSKQAEARNGKPYYRLLPGSALAVTLGCICTLGECHTGRAIVTLDDECPLPRYDSYSNYRSKGTPSLARIRHQQQAWSYHMVREP